MDHGATVDVDVDADADTDAVSTTSMVMRKTKTIALEGRHSALAWRTIHWVCSTDSGAYDIKRRVFESPKWCWQDGRAHH
jgi:hypothetical protein